jgi:hypothetical protein
VEGGGLGVSSKLKANDGGFGGTAACSSIEFSILKQSKHRNDMWRSPTDAASLSRTDAFSTGTLWSLPNGFSQS